MENPNELSFNVLTRITQIVKKLENSKLSDDVIEELKLPLQELSEYLNVSIIQTIIFTIIFALQIKLYSIDLRDIINFLDIDYLDSIGFKNDIDKLIEKDLVEAEQENKRKSKKSIFGLSDLTIKVDISESIYENRSITRKEKETLDIYGFVNKVSKYI